MKISKRHYCAVPSCPNLVEAGESFCEEHRPKYKRNGRKIYNTSRWQRLRKKILAEEPLCRECQKNGIVRPAVEVDHIIPLAEGGTNSRENLQPLCKSCHSKKTMSEIRKRGGAG